MYYTLDGEHVTDTDLERRFDEYLDETHDEYPIMGVSLRPSVILRECDPVAYREAFNNYIDSEGWEEI